MEKELEQFQQEAQRLKEGRKGGALPFPKTLRAFAVRYAEQTVEAGGTVVEAAGKLGVSAPTLYEWRKGRTAGSTRRKKPTEKRGGLVPVRVGERPAEAAVAPAGPLSVVAPGGFRVEGLSVEAAAQLLRKLGC
jgi:hypothetical protein